MTWARFDDKYSEHPKIEAAGPWAELLDMRAIIYACRNETDGAISSTALAKISAGIPKVKARVETLIEVGRWLPNELGGGWWIHSFLDYNPSKAQLREHRDKGKQRAKSSREAKANERANETRTYARTDDASRTGARGPGHSVEKLSVVEELGAPWVTEGITRDEWRQRAKQAQA